jgi:hypothetical protein
VKQKNIVSDFFWEKKRQKRSPKNFSDEDKSDHWDFSA